MNMRAKLQVSSVTPQGSQETIKFKAVSKLSYPGDGSDEDNTYARYTPMANVEMVIANPNLVGKYKAGQKFYVDFTPAE